MAVGRVAVALALLTCINAENKMPGVVEVGKMNAEPVDLFAARRRSPMGGGSARRRGGFGGGGGGRAYVSEQGVGGVIKDAFLKTIFGFILVILAYPVLYYNEKRQVHMDAIFIYAASIVQDGVSSTPLSEGNEDKLVNVQGETQTDEVLEDPESGINVTNCAKLKSYPEVWCWVETKNERTEDTSGGGKRTITTFSYNQQWSSFVPNTDQFDEPEGHENPDIQLTSFEGQASDVKFGDYQLTDSLISQMIIEAPVNSEPDITVQGRQLMLQGDVYTDVQGEPQIGNINYRLTKVECGQATVLSLQTGNTFTPLTYKMLPASKCCACFGGGPSKGDKVDALSDPLLSDGQTGPEVHGCFSLIGAAIQAGEGLDNLAEGHCTASKMIARAKNSQGMLHWILRVVGYVMLFVGFLFQFQLFPTFFRIIPFIGTWIQAFGNSLAFMCAFLMATINYMLILAVTWLALRPFKAVILFALVAILIVGPEFIPVAGGQQ